MGSSDTWSDIILGKQVIIHVYSIEVRYLSLMSIDNPLHARFTRGYFFCRLFLLFMFHVSLYYAIFSVPYSLVVACWEGLASCVWCFYVFLLLSNVVSRVACGAWLYQFLIFALNLTLNNRLLVLYIWGIVKTLMSLHIRAV